MRGRVKRDVSRQNYDEVGQEVKAKEIPSSLPLPLLPLFFPRSSDFALQFAIWTPGTGWPGPCMELASVNRLWMIIEALLS